MKDYSFNGAFLFVFAHLVFSSSAQAEANNSGELLSRIWCQACHNVDGAARKDKKAASFPEISKRQYLTKEFIVQWVLENNHPVMPKINITPEQRQAIADYLLSFRGYKNRKHSLEREIAPQRKEARTYMSRVLPGRSTGFFISNKGEVITAAHDVLNCRSLRVEFANKVLKAKIEILDREQDISLLSTGTNPKAFISLDEIAKPDLGVEIFSIGFPLPGVLSADGVYSRGFVTATSGAFQNRKRFQSDLQVLPGGSGSPVLTVTGLFIGMNICRLQTDTSSISKRCAPFAIKAKEIQNFYHRYLNSKSARLSAPTRVENSIASVRDSLVRVACIP